MGKTFKLQGKEVPFNAIVEQQLLDFLESKGFSNDEIIKRVIEWYGEGDVMTMIESWLPITTVSTLFYWDRTPKSEGNEFWDNLNIEYRKLKKINKMVTETEKKIYVRLMEMRKESGVTYYALKKVAGIPQHALKAIESGSRSCTMTTILKLLEQYKRTPSELFNGIE